MQPSSRGEDIGTQPAERPGLFSRYRTQLPCGLTPREVEVLRLIAQGLSNRDIGDELVITESTVRRHVSNIYDKIGVSNRTEAARYALAQGL